jgi:large subunit ribosomal protein L23
METEKVIKKPVFSETSLDQAANGRFTFEVALEANKKEIARAVENSFDVDVLSVKTRIIKGKRSRIRGTSRERLGKKIKKATVELEKDQKISAFEVTKK